MIQAKCIQKFRDKNNHIYGYRLQDLNGQTQDVHSDNLKQAIASGQIHVVNLTLTKDERLVDTTEHHLQSKQLGPDPKLQLSNSSHQETTNSRTFKEHSKESKLGNKQNVSYSKALLSINKMIHKAVSEYDMLFDDKFYYYLKDISKNGEALGIRPHGKLDDGNIHLVYLSAPIHYNTYVALLASYDGKTIKYYIADAYHIHGFEFDWVDLHEEEELEVNAESEYVIHTYASEDTIKAEIKNVVHAFINAVTEYFEGAVQYTVKKYNELDNNHTWKIGNNARILIDDNV